MSAFQLFRICFGNFCFLLSQFLLFGECYRHRNGSKAAGLNLRADHSRCALPPVYPQQLAHELGLGGDGLMDALGLSFKKFSLE